MKPQSTLLPYADGGRDYTGHRACINTNQGDSLHRMPWSIYLDTPKGWQKLCDCGSYATAYAEFKRRGLVPTGDK